MLKIAQTLAGHKKSWFQLKEELFSPFYSEKRKYFLGRKNVFGVIGTLTEKLKQVTGKAKKSIEEKLNISFQMLEEGLRQTMSLLDETSDAHNNLEQYEGGGGGWYLTCVWV